MNDIEKLRDRIAGLEDANGTLRNNAKCNALRLADLERLERLERVVKAVLAQNADDVCWRDVYEEMAALVGMPYKPTLLPRPQFLRNCEHFHKCLAMGEHYEAPAQ